MNPRNYPFTFLERVRHLAYRGTYRASIFPKDRIPDPPPEQVHSESVIIPSVRTGQLLVLEWSDDGRLERHRVDLLDD